MTDNWNLHRFLTAQQDTFESALKELESGRKRTHWMWFIFPQVEGLATSDTARKYAIRSLDEAREYSAHPILGMRLRKCVEVLLALEGVSANDIFSYPDDLKIKSSMTLFYILEGENSVFQDVLNKYFRGEMDEKTVEIVNRINSMKQPINYVPVLPDSHAFKVFGERVTKDRKDRSGDSFAVSLFDDEELLLLAVADGVSSSPCDWKASEVACEALVGRFKSAEGSVAQRMVNATSKAHNAVRQIEGRCAGSYTSLTFVVWPVMSDEVYVLNVGDSRAYIGPDNSIESITSDDVQPVGLEMNDKLVLQAGARVFRQLVTRSLGQAESLEFIVQTHSFQNNELLLLVSDGISKNEAFTSEFPHIFSGASIEQKLSNLVAESSPRNKDDATLIAVWRKPVNDACSEQRIEDCFRNNSDFRTEGISPVQAVELLKNKLLDRMNEGNNELVGGLLDYADRFGIRFSQDFLSDLLSLVIRQDTDRHLVTRLRDLIRRSR